MKSKTKKTTAPKTKIDGKLIAFMFDKFLKLNRDNYIIQTAIAKKLIRKYGEEVWRHITLGFSLNTLHYFCREEGERVIEEALKKMKALEVKKSVDISEERVYNPAEPVTKNKSLKQRFLNE